MKKKIGMVCLVATCLVAWTLQAQDPDGPALTEVDGVTQAQIAAGDPTDPAFIDPLRYLGLLVFTTPFNTHDGLGDGEFIPSEVIFTPFGDRPTLQGNGQHLRINGLDAQSCNECHSIVNNSSKPPELGFGGAGGVSQSAMPAASLVDVADSFDDRVQYVPGHDPDLPLVTDGVADFNGRFINPPFLYGGGGVELLAREMTSDLQDLLDQAQTSPSGTVVSLDTHGVNFGVLTSLGSGDVFFNLVGIGSLDAPQTLGSGDNPEEQLVVRPFGRKGEAFSMRDFDRGAMQFHFGMQPFEVLEAIPEIGDGDADGDHDNVIDEVTVPEMSVLHLFSVTNPKPTQDPFVQFGFQRFKQTGCRSCHVPAIDSDSNLLSLAYPEVAEEPDTNVYMQLDMLTYGFDPASSGPGIKVPLFSDLKRHDMGPDLAESCETCGVPNQEFITARLWGVADTAPYLHDGRATTLYEAIVAHGGEAQDERDAFLALAPSQQLLIIDFLKTLRTPVNPNVDLLP